MRQTLIISILAIPLLTMYSTSCLATDWFTALLGGGKSSGGGNKSSSSGSSNGNSSVYVGFGGGDVTGTKPSTGFNPNTNLYAIAGLEFRFFHSRLLLDLGAQGFLGAGNLNYDYTGTDAVHYTANDLHYNASSAEFTAGLKYRLIDSSEFRFYLEAGGLWGSEKLTYDSTHLITQGSKYLGNEDSISLNGYFGDAGFELGSPAHGFRIAGRYNSVSTANIKALANSKTAFHDLIGYLAVYNGF